MDNAIYIGCLVIVFLMGLSASLLFRLIAIFTTNSRLNLYKTDVEKTIQNRIISQFSYFFTTGSLGFFAFLTSIYLTTKNSNTNLLLILCVGFFYIASVLHYTEGLKIRYLYRKYGEDFIFRYTNILRRPGYYIHSLIAAVLHITLYVVNDGFNLYMVAILNIHIIYLFHASLKYIKKNILTEKIIYYVTYVSMTTIFFVVSSIIFIGFSHYYLLVIGTQAQGYLTWSGVLLFLIMSDNAYIHYNKSVQDSLTGVYNRRYFNLKLKDITQKAATQKQTTSLIVFDIDDFKLINDSHGHDIGDLAIKHFVNVSFKFLREGDVMSRVGGEEFAIILPNTTLNTAQDIAERIRNTVENSAFSVQDLNNMKITGSFGVASSGDNDKKTLFKNADTAMYHAKKSGKNQVFIYQ